MRKLKYREIISRSAEAAKPEFKQQALWSRAHTDHCTARLPQGSLLEGKTWTLIQFTSYLITGNLHYKVLLILFYHMINLFLEWVSEWVKVVQSCLTLCNPMEYTIHGILQSRILEWVTFPFSSGSSPPRTELWGKPCFWGIRMWFLICCSKQCRNK